MGRIINGSKYMYYVNHNGLKNKSLEDNLYFTLREIFHNADSADICIQANEYNDILSGNITYEERNHDFQYTNMLCQKNELKKLINWLDKITPGWFEFVESSEIDINQEEYMNFDSWWEKFVELKDLLREKYEKIEI